MPEITIPDKNCYSIPQYVSGRRIRVEIDGRDYEWQGGFGSVLKSNERGVEKGDVRCIGGILFHAYSVYRPLSPIGFWRKSKAEVSWTIPNDHISAEWISEFKKALFL